MSWGRLVDPRFGRLLKLAALLIPVYFGLAFVLLFGMSRRASFAVGGATAVTILIVTAGAIQAWGTFTPRLIRTRLLLTILVMWGLMPGVAVALILLAAHFSLTVVGIGTLVATGLGMLAYRRYTSRVKGDQLLSVVIPESLSEAETVRLAAARPSYRKNISPDLFAIQRINYARASIMLATRESDYDRVAEALPILRQVIEDTQLNLALAVSAADDLVNAESVLAERSRDGMRYGQAVELFDQLATAVGTTDPVRRARIHYHRAGYQQFVMRAQSDDSEHVGLPGSDTFAAFVDRFIATYESAEREIRCALSLVPPRTEVQAEYLTFLGSLLVCMPDDEGGRHDEGVAILRQVLRMRTPYRRSRLASGRMMLMLGLYSRADFRSDQAELRAAVLADLREAQRLANGLVPLGNPYAARARALLADIAALFARLK